MKNLFLTIMAFGLFLTSCQKDSFSPTDSEDNIQNREKHEICMSSYNTWLLDATDIGIGPQCNGQDCIDRALKICDEVTSTGNEILNLQEVWEGPAAAALKKCLEDKGYSVNFNLNSGLMTATTLKTISSTFEEFLVEAGVDCVKDKGFHVSVFELENGCQIANINTHLQADLSDGFIDDLANTGCFGSSLTEAKIRAFQILQIRTRVNILKGIGIPVYLGGDFNIKFGSAEYPGLVSLATDVYTLTGTIPSRTNTDGNILDYILFSDVTNSTRVTSVTVPTSVKVTNWYISITCPEIKEPYKYGPFASKELAEAYEISPYCTKTVFEESFYKNTQATVSDHLQIQVCFEYDCTEQLEVDTVDPVDPPLGVNCDPNMDKFDCLMAGGVFYNGKCICK